MQSLILSFSPNSLLAPMHIDYAYSSWLTHLLMLLFVVFVYPALLLGDDLWLAVWYYQLRCCLNLIVQSVLVSLGLGDSNGSCLLLSEAK